MFGPPKRQQLNVQFTNTAECGKVPPPVLSALQLHLPPAGPLLVRALSWNSLFTVLPDLGPFCSAANSTLPHMFLKLYCSIS